jgi:site-specific recombinase
MEKERMYQLDQEAAKHLTDAVNSVKVNTERLVAQMELIYTAVEKLENSIEKINDSLMEQDRRITILEQAVPKNLIEDVALIKASQASSSKFLWMVAGIAGTTFINMIFRYFLK